MNRGRPKQPDKPKIPKLSLPKDIIITEISETLPNIYNSPR